MTPTPPFKAIPNERIAAMHACYERLTGFTLALKRAFVREYQWSVWLAQGWGEPELELVIGYIRKHHREYWAAMCRFTKLITDLEVFEEYLSMAQAERRSAPKPRDARQQVLAQAHRPTEAPEAPAKAVGEIVKDLTSDYEKLRKAAGI